MKNSTGSWLLDTRSATRAMRSGTLGITLLYAVFVQLFVSDGSIRPTPSLFLITVVYCGALLSIMHAHRRGSRRPRSITVKDGILAIPRCFFMTHLVPITQIKSIEKCAGSVRIIAVVIGRISRSSIVIERRKFASDEEFEGFMQFIDQLHHQINARDTKGVVQGDVVRRWGQGSGVIGVVAVTLFATYLMSSRPGIEQISTDALAVGGLIKGSVHTGIYRIASSFFLHATPFHLGFNILVLAIFGQCINVIFGRVRLIVILFASAIMGSILSLACSPYETVIGASGGIFGLIGAYSFLCARHYHQIPGSVSISPRRILLILGLEVVLDLMLDGTDIFSHLGGFVFGFLYSYYVLRRHTPADASTYSPVEFCIAAGLVLAYAAALIHFFSLNAGLG